MLHKKLCVAFHLENPVTPILKYELFLSVKKDMDSKHMLFIEKLI